MLSVQRQTFANLKAVFIDDGSNDNTWQMMQQITDERFSIERYEDNKGAAYRRFNAIKKHATDENDIVLLLGLDDALFDKALQVISIQYLYGKWMTYGSWKDSDGNKMPVNELYFDDATHAARTYRKVKYRSTAPNTFRRFLFDRLTEDDFTIQGEWFTATTESNLMFCCLEMCGKERIGVIEKPIYFYNKRRSESTRSRIGEAKQNFIYQNVVSRETKPLYERTMDKSN